jgi:adenylate cyclase
MKFLLRYKKHFARILACLLALLIIWLSLFASNSGLLNRVEYLLYDWRYSNMLPLAGRNAGQHNIAIIDIDEASLAEDGRWPWSRQKIAQLVEHLYAAGVLVVAFDVVFSEAELNPAGQLLDMLAPGDAPGTRHMLQNLHVRVDADAAFAAAMPERDVVLGFFFQDDKQYQTGLLPMPVYEIPEPLRNNLVITERPGYTGNLPVLQNAAASGGFVTMFPDQDGSVRRAPLVIRHGNDLYPSLSLAAAMRYLFVSDVEVHFAQVGDVNTMTSLSLSEYPAATDAQGAVLVPYRGPARTFPYISASDVLHDRTGDSLQGAVVFVGTSAIGLADLRNTPMGPQYPGVEVHANILEALLDGGIPYRPDWQAGANFVQLMLIAILLIVVLPKLGPSGMLFTGAGVFALVISWNFYQWYLGLDMPLAASLLLTISLTLLFIADGFVRENATRKRLKGMFDQYVPPAHINMMLDNPAAYSFSGESKVMTVLFSDIRSFTSISEKLNAQELKLMLNTYFTPITKEIFDNDGTIDKYVGDMVMAFWGAPLDDAKHREHAITAALRMQEVTEQLKPMFAAQGLPEVNVGIGLNTGAMNVGDMGSTYRRAYTVLGDAVNLGSRLESITKFYGAKILVGEDTRDGVDAFVFRFVDRIQVKGKEEAIRVYEPLGASGQVAAEVLAELAQYDAAYALYLAREWDAAEEAFCVLQQQSPKKLYEVYLERLADLRVAELPENWDGTFRHTSK